MIITAEIDQFITIHLVIGHPDIYRAASVWIITNRCYLYYPKEIYNLILVESLSILNGRLNYRVINFRNLKVIYVAAKKYLYDVLHPNILKLPKLNEYFFKIEGYLWYILLKKDPDFEKKISNYIK